MFLRAGGAGDTCGALIGGGRAFGQLRAVSGYLREGQARKGGLFGAVPVVVAVPAGFGEGLLVVHLAEQVRD